jgi:hypothetical protein
LQDSARKVLREDAKAAIEERCEPNADLQLHDKKDYFPDDRAYLVTNSPSTR